MIERRTVGFSGLQVSALSFGAMTFAKSGPYARIAASEAEMARLVDVALEAGVDTFDTANVYGAGESEAILGKLIGKRRSSVVLTTKARFATGDEAGRPSYGGYGLSRHALTRSVEASLTRLGTDYIDLLYLHMQDRTVPIEETLRAADDLVRAGKVRYLGLSNYMAYRAVEALWVADKRNLSTVSALQVPWSLVNRDVETELVPAAWQFRLGLIAYSPLARGFLSGKYDGSPPAQGTRLAEWKEEWNDADRPRNWAILDALRKIARRHEVAVSSVALAWVLSRRGVASVVLGARTEAQLLENLGSASLKLTRDELAELDKVSEPQWTYPCSFIKRFEQW